MMNWLKRLFGRKPNVLRLPPDWIKAADEQDAKGLPCVEVIGRPSSFTRIGYEIVIGADGQKAIKCLRCQKTSYSSGDVQHLYCANCKIFHSPRRF